MRKSFIVHNDSLAVLDDLTDEECGQLFKAIKSYQLGEETTLPSIIKIAFSPFKNQFIRDEVKYENIVNRNRNNGLKGGRPKNPTEPSGLSGNPKEPKEADSDSDSKSDSKSDSDSDSDSDSNKTLDQSALDREFDDVWSLYGKKGNKKTSKARYFKLSKAKKLKLLAHIPVYVLSTPDKQYRKNFETYLNQEVWNDEVTHETHQQANQPKPSLVDRIKANTTARREERASRRFSGQPMGENGSDVRTQVCEPIRGDSGRDLDNVLDGDFWETDG